MSADDPLTTDALEKICSEIGELITDRVIIEEQTFVIQRPKNAVQLQQHPVLRSVLADDGYAPYWTDLWPAARMLAKAILREAWTPGSEALEIGCGLGLPGVAALSRGLRVTFSDYDPVALHFAGENARRNGWRDFQLLRLDWRSWSGELRFPVVLASDLIYELKNVEPLLDLIRRVLLPGGRCLLTDQDRVPSHALRATLAAKGLIYTTQLMRAGEPGGRRVKGTLYSITQRDAYGPEA